MSLMVAAIVTRQVMMTPTRAKVAHGGQGMGRGSRSILRKRPCAAAVQRLMPRRS